MLVKILAKIMVKILAKILAKMLLKILVQYSTAVLKAVNSGGRDSYRFTDSQRPTFNDTRVTNLKESTKDQKKIQKIHLAKSHLQAAAFLVFFLLFCSGSSILAFWSTQLPHHHSLASMTTVVVVGCIQNCLSRTSF